MSKIKKLIALLLSVCSYSAIFAELPSSSVDGQIINMTTYTSPSNSISNAVAAILVKPTIGNSVWVYILDDGSNGRAKTILAHAIDCRNNSRPVRIGYFPNTNTTIFNTTKQINQLSYIDEM